MYRYVYFLLARIWSQLSIFTNFYSRTQYSQSVVAQTINHAYRYTANTFPFASCVKWTPLLTGCFLHVQYGRFYSHIVIERSVPHVWSTKIYPASDVAVWLTTEQTPIQYWIIDFSFKVKPILATLLSLCHALFMYRLYISSQVFLQYSWPDSIIWSLGRNDHVICNLLPIFIDGGIEGVWLTYDRCTFDPAWPVRNGSLLLRGHQCCFVRTVLCTATCSCISVSRWPTFHMQSVHFFPYSLYLSDNFMMLIIYIVSISCISPLIFSEISSRVSRFD